MPVCCAAAVWRLERVRVLNNTTGQEALFICNEGLETSRERSIRASVGEPDCTAG